MCIYAVAYVHPVVDSISCSESVWKFRFLPGCWRNPYSVIVTFGWLSRGFVRWGKKRCLIQHPKHNWLFWLQIGFLDISPFGTNVFFHAFPDMLVSMTSLMKGESITGIPNTWNFKGGCLRISHIKTQTLSYRIRIPGCRQILYLKVL